MSEAVGHPTASDGRRRPSLGLLRDLTDDHVLDQLLGGTELTRAEIAARTGISKPTISESVRRLQHAGLIDESGRQSGKRGPAATFYRLSARSGVAFVLSAGPDGVIGEIRDLRGELIATERRPVRSPSTARELAPIITGVCRAVLADPPGPVLAAAVSVANPVDRRSGRLVRLPDSPFLLDELDPGELLDELVGVPVQVDNDVNWAALAEHTAGAAVDLDDFVYCYLGPGLGLGLVLDGRLVGGHRGLAGELAYLLTEGPDGRSRRLLECFGDWGLLRPDSWAIDVTRLADVLRAEAPAEAALRDAILRAVAGALATVVAMVNPQAIVIAQDWGFDGDLIALLADRVAEAAATSVELRPAAGGEHPPLVGARTQALRSARNALLDR